MHEFRFRVQRNCDLAVRCKFDLPSWNDLKVYGSALQPQNTDDPECTKGGMPL